MATNTLNPFVAIIAEKKAQLQQLLEKLHFLERRVVEITQYLNDHQGTITEAQALAQMQGIEWGGKQHPAVSWAQAIATWISQGWPTLRTNMNATINALQREIADLAVKRDELDQRAVAAIAGGASAEDAYNGVRAQMQFKQTAFTVLKYGLIVIGVGLLIWGAVWLFKRINRTKA